MIAASPVTGHRGSGPIGPFCKWPAEPRIPPAAYCGLNRSSIGGDVPAAAQMIEVLVVDDHPGFRRILCSLLAADPDISVVGEASDGEEAVAKCLELVPNVVLLDVRMPGTGGIEAARAIKDVLPTARVLMLSGSDEEDDLYKALRAGASGYLLKDTALEDLAASVRTAAGGQSVLSPTMAAKLVAEFDRATPDPEPGLSERETEILRLVAEGCANREIAERLFLSPHTVKRHMANILAKLHQRTRLEAAMFELRRNLLD
jgi:DNA-binding NarL/FixJ family response regulator